jgi:predicted RNase H-like HicB family nuclease
LVDSGVQYGGGGRAAAAQLPRAKSSRQQRCASSAAEWRVLHSDYEKLRKLQGTTVMTEATSPYYINLFWSAEDACWVADVPDLRFCSAFGDTPEAAAREVQVAIRAWLASAHQHGDPIPEPRYRQAIYTARGVAYGNG